MIKPNDKDKVPKGHKRSPQWHDFRKKHIKEKCEVCESTENLELHHIIPVHISPKDELKPKNVITLCENKKDGLTCHLAIGHLGSYKSWNVNVRKDAKAWAKKIKERP
ncbi:MAG: HNH endonuclease [Pseudobdellovibrionaceae bacterium]